MFVMAKVKNIFSVEHFTFTDLHSMNVYDHEYSWNFNRENDNIQNLNIGLLTWEIDKFDGPLEYKTFINIEHDLKQKIFESFISFHFKILPRNKPDRATMRPDCILTWSEIRADRVRQMDEQT